MSASLPGLFNFQAFADAGLPLVGGRLYTYAPGTTTQKVAYTDAAASIPHTYVSDGLGGLYIALDARGELPAPLFLTSGGYDIALKTALGVTVWTRRAIGGDDVASSGIALIRSDLADTTDQTKGSALIGFNPQLTYPDYTLGASLAAEEWNLFWFTGVRAAVTAGTDCTAAVAAVVALRVASGGGTLYAPRAPVGGAWLFSGGTTQPDGYKNGILMPFSSVNPDPTKGLRIRGEQGTVFKCGSNNMILIRRSRNFGVIDDLVLDANGKTGCILDAVVPEDMTQTTTQVSQQYMYASRIQYLIGPGNTGRWIQPGPRVAGADSGCFYMVWRDCVSTSAGGGGRHVRSNKGSTWGTDSNRLTRAWFLSETTMRGNVGYDFDVGSEITIEGNDELIADGTSPYATPTARKIASTCSNIIFRGGYSEACTESFVCGSPGVVSCYGYIPASGGTTDFRANVRSYGDGGINTRTFTPVLASSGGGAQGAGTSTGYCERVGNTVEGWITINVGKGTLAAGSLSISGLPYAAKTGGQYAISVSEFSGVNLTAPNTLVGGFISSATITLRKSRVDGASSTSINVSEINDPVSMTINFSFPTD